MTFEEASKWMNKGVVIVDHNTSYIDEDVEIGDGTTIYPNVTIRGKSVIGKNNIIDSNTVLVDIEIGDNNKIMSSYLNASKIGNDNMIGPFTHFREKVILGNNNVVGNFVEMKGNVIGDHNNFKHLSYIGNAEVKNNVNFGAGSITANYDSIRHIKNKTIVEDGASIGSNVVLVAPVTLSKKAFVAAGSVITKDVGERDLAIARSRQENKKEYIKEN